jgi:predicted polyphosphate/ATP-dependent NAD kinase
VRSMHLPTRAIAESVVGVVANPESGRDVRRLIARASVFTIADKCGILIRLIQALGATGVTRVLMIPDRGGIADRVERTGGTLTPDQYWPRIEILDMPVENSHIDTVRGTEHMVAAGANAIVALGGDGTQRWVASVCGEIPLMPVQGGTNNAFSEFCEATIAGLATGLVATGKIPTGEATLRNKFLRVEVDGVHRYTALVDVSVSKDRWAGSKALWRPASLDQIFVAFAEPCAVGLSSVAGLLRPVPRSTPNGLRVDLAPLERAKITLTCPLAPGLVLPVGIEHVEEMHCGKPYRPRIPVGMMALDGEREVGFDCDRDVAVRLDDGGPLTIDIAKVMARAARDGLLVTRWPNCRGGGSCGTDTVNS